MLSVLGALALALAPQIAIVRRRIYYYGPATVAGLLTVHARCAELCDAAEEGIELHLQGVGGHILPSLCRY